MCFLRLFGIQGYGATSMNKVPLVIIGGGGHAKVVIETALAAGYCIKKILDDDDQVIGSSLLGVRVEGPIKHVLQEGDHAVIAIGNNTDRRNIYNKNKNINWCTVVHPSAVISPTAQIGIGVVAFANVVLNADSVVGDHSILNTACSIDHDCRVGAFSHIAPRVAVAGGVNIGENCFLGVGSAVLPNISIGKNSVIGGGGVVIRSVPENVVVVGNPTRVISKVESCCT